MQFIQVDLIKDKTNYNRMYAISSDFFFTRFCNRNNLVVRDRRTITGQEYLLAPKECKQSIGLGKEEFK